MKEDVVKKYLINRDETGRFIVKSMKTNKTYFVETIDGEERTALGDFDPVTKKFHTSEYGSKYKGSIKPEESMITEENGFEKIHTLGVGESPLSYIDKLDEEYYQKSLKEDIVKTVADKLIGTEILGLDINGQWYDSIKNGGKPIKNPFKNERENNNKMS